MKKILIFVAFVFTFHLNEVAAQSNITLYGLVDLGYGVGNNGHYEMSSGRDSKFQQWGSPNFPSHWGMKGTEQLREDLSVFFNLEQFINPEDGSTFGSFDRAALVGLSGKFGTIQFGRQPTAMLWTMEQFDISGAPNVTSTLGNLGLSGIAQKYGTYYYSRMSSAVLYLSPNLNGLNFNAAFVSKNDDSGLNNIADKSIYALGGSYKFKGFTVGAAYESKPQRNVSAAWGLGVKYDFGKFIATAGYYNAHLNTDGYGYYAGFSVPIGAFTLGAQVAYNNGAKAAGEDLNAFAWELFGKYSLSKRTRLYVQYGGLNHDAKTFIQANRSYSASVGLMHSF